MIGIIQRFGMDTELPQRKNTVFLLYHQKNPFGKTVLTSTSILIARYQTDIINTHWNTEQVQLIPQNHTDNGIDISDVDLTVTFHIAFDWVLAGYILWWRFAWRETTHQKLTKTY